MTRALRSIWIWGATTVLVLFWVPLLWVVKVLDRDPMRRRTARWFRKLGPLVAKINPAWRIHVDGLQHVNPNATYVIVSNHQSLADIPLVSHLRQDAKWLGKAELLQVPIFGWCMRMAGDIGVERGDRRKAAQALLKCANCLRNGVSVVFFPEGTRSRTGEVLAFNDGPFQLALREKIPVLPLVIEGTGNALPRSTWMFGEAQDIHLRVLEAVPSTEWTDCGALRDRVRQLIVDELMKLRSVPVRK
jgi:1-acyl-sn-glycerol-3-phosphate acyltransferase